MWVSRLRKKRVRRNFSAGFMADHNQKNNSSKFQALRPGFTSFVTMVTTKVE
jgi:hypothetical protein